MLCEFLSRPVSRVLIFVYLSLVAATAHGNPLLEFVNAKINANPDIIAAEQALVSAKAALDLTASSLYPTLGASWTSSTNNQRDGFGNLVSLEATQTLFGGGGEYTELQAARLGVAQAEHELADVRDRIQARFAYKLAQLSINRERLETRKKVKRAQEERLSELQRRFRIGQSREPDLLQVQVESSRLDRRISDNLTAIEKDEQQIRALLLLDESEMSKLNALLNPQGVRILYGSLSPRPEYRKAALDLARAALARRESSAWLTATPTLGLYGQRNLVRPSDATNSWEWGLRAQWTFFEGFKTPSRVEAAKAQRIVAERKLFALEYERASSLARLAREAERSEAKKDAITADIARATKALKQQQRDYRLGVVTELEVQQTIQSALDLELELLDIQETRALLHLQKFLGGEPIP